MDIEFDGNHRVIYKGVTLSITQEQIFDLQIYGIDPENFILELYKNSLIYIRDKKIDDILRK